ncbi:MAG: MBL fold metallo-hydrolase [Lachnospiraceae bacterium]|nr:MBL fold metallo-hydrolase [Lachnospiraceae bacterium]
MKVTILGARGSIPTEGPEMLEFGGGTSCVLVENEDSAIFLDAGTGIINSPDIGDKAISILMTHPHLDHVLGLPFFPYIFEKGRDIGFYAGKNGLLTTYEQLGTVFSNPLWPCRIEDYPSGITFHDAEFPLQIGEFTITGIPSVHPGGGIVYRLEDNGKSIIYATDYEYMEDKIGDLIEFAKDCDLLLFDAQYTDEEFEMRRGYGHSTVAQGLEVMKKSGTKNIRFVHHDPRHTDEFLRKMEAPVKSEYVAFARKDEVIIL